MIGKSEAIFARNKPREGGGDYPTRKAIAPEFACREAGRCKPAGGAAGAGCYLGGGSPGLGAVREAVRPRYARWGRVTTLAPLAFAAAIRPCCSIQLPIC